MDLRNVGLRLAALVVLVQMAACGGGGGGNAGTDGGGSGGTSAGGGGGSSGGGSGGAGGGTGGGSGGGTGGGSGGGSTSPPAVTASFAVTPGEVTFTALGPSTAAPFGSFVKGTVTGTVTGTLYVNIDIAGPAVKSVDTLTIFPNSNSGTAQVVPQVPWGLGVGTFVSTLTVHACQGDQSCKTGELIGSPQTINVTYTIGSSLGDGAVNPFEVPSGTQGDLVLRGGVWSTLAVPTSLSIGSKTALAFTHPDPTTFTVTYPALTAGVYPINTNNNDRLATLNVVDVPVFAPHSMPYPSNPGFVAGAGGVIVQPVP